MSAAMPQIDLQHADRLVLDWIEERGRLEAAYRDAQAAYRKARRDLMDAGYSDGLQAAADVVLSYLRGNDEKESAHAPNS